MLTDLTLAFPGWYLLYLDIIQTDQQTIVEIEGRE